MKVLILNGSPREGGNTDIAIREMVGIFDAEGIETEVIRVGREPVQGCTGCGACFRAGKCVHDDLVNDLAAKLMEADGLVAASPVYYASANGALIAVMDRLFYSTMRLNKTMKVGASVAVARRGGCSSTFDQLNKYFTTSGMPLASSLYWNSVHGAKQGQAEEDAEGLQTMRILARNMAFLMKSIALGKEAFGLPEAEKRQFTNFIR